MTDYKSTGQFGVFTGFRLMPKPDYGFYVETGVNYIGKAKYESELEVYFQIGICRKFLNKKPI